MYFTQYVLPWVPKRLWIVDPDLSENGSKDLSERPALGVHENWVWSSFFWMSQRARKFAGGIPDLSDAALLAELGERDHNVDRGHWFRYRWLRLHLNGRRGLSVAPGVSQWCLPKISSFRQLGFTPFSWTSRVVNFPAPGDPEEWLYVMRCSVMKISNLHWTFRLNHLKYWDCVSDRLFKPAYRGILGPPEIAGKRKNALSSIYQAPYATMRFFRQTSHRKGVRRLPEAFMV